MLSKRLFRTLPLLLFFLVSLNLIAQNNFREFSQELSQPYVYSISQDHKGYLWIGTGNGLTKYDGLNFKSYTVKDSLGDNFISCSLSDTNNIWFGHMNGSISLFDGTKLTSPNTFIQNSGITDIEKNPNGEVWASSASNGLVLLNSKQVKQVPIENQTSIFSFSFYGKNKILVGSEKGLLYCSLHSGELKIIKIVAGIPESKVSDIIKMRNGSGFYIATENEGIYKVVIKGKEITASLINTKTPVDFSGIQRIFEDSRSNLWIASFGNGIVKLNYNHNFEKATIYNKTTGYSTNYVKTVYEDHEGNMWCGNYGTGLTQITGKTFYLESFDDLRYGSSIYSVFIADNIRWIGTGKGLLKVDNSSGDILAFYSNSNGLPADKITSIISLNNNLWIGTEKNGIYCLFAGKGRFTPLKISNGDLENSIVTIAGKNEQVWIGTKKGACHIDLTTNKIIWYTHSQGGLPHNSVNHLLIDSKGKVWVLTQSNTLSIIENGKVGKKILFSEKRIHSLGPIIEENENTFWIGSLGSGVFQIKDDTLANFTTKEGLLSDYCYSMVLDENKTLWIGHRGGISKIRSGDFFIKPIQEYSGIKSSCEFNPNAVFRDSKNRISFGTSEGLWTYEPALENMVSSKPPILNLTSIKVNDKEIPITDNLKLAPGKYKIEINYIGINLKEPDLVYYKYELTGYDRSPVTTKTTSIIYNLDEGDYTFSLWAFSGDGVVTKTPQSFSIHIKTPLWKHWWFYIIIIVLFQLIFILYNNKKELKHIQEKRILEAKVRERTSELALKNTQLEEKQLEIIYQNKELEKYQNYLEDLVQARTVELIKAKDKAEESDRLKTSILNNLSHEVRTPMNAICGFSKLLEDDSLSKKERADYIRIINHNSETLLTMMSEILDMSLIESNQLVITKEVVDIHQVLIDIESEFKTNNNKKVDLEFINKYHNSKSFVKCDANRLRQILSNLLNNAFKFTEAGHIKYGYEVSDKTVKFFVSDTGIGIAKADIDKIFDLFHKVENNPKKFYRGAGIGLATNKKIVELMGGEIWVDSIINEGSTFYFTLPLN